MKKITMTLLAVVATATTVFATSLYTSLNDKPISRDELPAEAQKFIAAHFADEEISHIILDRDVISVDYNVTFSSGTKLEFNSRGEWKEVDMRNAAVPNDLVPQAIAEYVKQNYPNRQVVEIKRNHTYTEISLQGGLELTFNRNYQVVDIDD